MATEFRVLGPLEVRRGGEPVVVPAGKARVLLATLLLRAGRVVAVDELVDRLWDDAPANPRAALHMVVTRLRQSLGPVDAVRTAPGGYVAEVDELDLHRFRSLVGEGHHAAALELWRGEPLSDVRSDVLHREDVAPLVEERLTAVERRVEADLAAGRADSVVAELRALTREHPFDERFWGLLVRALHASGRQAEALAAYRSVRALLADELGVDPGPRLQELHRGILADTGDASPPPRQVPVHAPLFVGRDEELHGLAKGLDDGEFTTAAITGPAGVGKTALAVRWAQQVAERFPDGQLYVNLRGFDPTGVPLEPDEAVLGFLHALGVPPERVPATPAARVALYRGVLAGRKVLVLLDNARDSEQVRPLLPGVPGCLAVVTSRDALTGLVAREGAVPLVLGVLEEDAAGELLRRRIGADRVAAEPGAVRDLVAHCAGLPLALAVVAARAAVQPSFPLRALAGELAEARLEALDSGDASTSVRTVFSWSHERLGAEAARMFDLLGAHPGPEVSVRAAASLAAVPPRAARAALAELGRVNLLVEHAPSRYSFHDLVHEYAGDRAGLLDAAEAQAAVHRLLDHYLHGALAGNRAVFPHRPTDTTAPLPGVVTPPIATREDALAWFDAERATLFATIPRAALHGFDHAWRIPQAIMVFCRSAGYWEEVRGAPAVAGDLARVESYLHRALDLVDDPRGRAAVHRNLAAVAEAASRYPEALARMRSALSELDQLGPSTDLASALNAVGWFHLALGEAGPALEPCGRALAMFTDLGDVLGRAVTSDSLGLAHHRLGDHDRAVRHFREALPLYRSLGERYEEAATLDRLGDAHRAAGDPDAARAAWHESLAVLGDLGHPEAARVRAKL
ncbi:AfsR/SARP family transcriptional regulator [Saccharothrix yanglingensis]|uniref:OmpR/PhoB-type domain-containing protein n=1 Tax=Saccharothrix yanglingensis TaxID=659496 RepID=A0ABU0X4A1_9PSEU|nr:BTAD domain-containing putative transcriptional regulator [Saccharothrix yanglingensis]MDQ2585424.1 hypothetical protein [Saccharothrix yanglingensis]